jgi:hypothetical protein
MPRAPPHSHVHDPPLPPLYCGRKPHRRLHRRGHPPPCHGPAAIGPRRRNLPHPCDPINRPCSATASPSQDRTDAEEPPRSSPSTGPGRALSPPSGPLTPFPPPLSLACGPAPQRRSPPSSRAAGPSGPKARPPARAGAFWAKIPPGPVGWRIPSLFLFPFIFPIFTYIFRC